MTTNELEKTFSSSKKINQKNLDTFLVTDDISVKTAMRTMNVAGERILFIIDAKKRLIGSLTDGDIRRWVLNEGDLNALIKDIYCSNPLFVEEQYNLADVRKLMLERKVPWIPIINKDHQVSNILLWEHVFEKEVSLPKEKIDIPVVIMAGGKGTRLDPFTKILPKPLIPIGDKAIIEVIMDKFNQYGINEFHVSINHKSRMIKAFFDESNTAYTINFVEEDKPLGTAGSLQFLSDKFTKNLLVTNCDIIIETDYAEIINFHEKEDYDLTIVGSFRHFTIPYGVCTIQNGGKLTSIDEKPESDYLVNTGMYVVKKDILKLIPKDEVFHMTDLVNKIIANDGKVGVFPIDEKSWIDMGQWEELHRSLKNLKIEN